MNQTTRPVTQELDRRGLTVDLDRKVKTTRYPGVVYVVADVMEQGAGDKAVVIWLWLRPYALAHDERAAMRCVPLGTVAAI